MKKMTISDEVKLMNQCCSEGEDLKIAAPDLAKTLTANALMNDDGW
jgi:hypothetical protein